MPSFRLVRNSLILMMLYAVPCGAQIVRGTVRHGATGEPVAGDQVLLLAGALEKGQTISKKDGTFQIAAQPSGAAPAALTVRVVHEGVSYDEPVRDSLDLNVKVYDSSKRVDGLNGFMSILQFQTQDKALEVMELYALSNDSKPPKTKVDPDNLDLTLPAGAQIRSITVAGPDNQPVKVTPTLAEGRENHYRIDFPIKPGLTKYAITYDLPYSDRIVFRRKGQYPMKQISVVLPKSMQFKSLGSKVFHRVGEREGAQVETLDALGQNEALEFELSGAGALSQAFRPLDSSIPRGNRVDKLAAGTEIGLPQSLRAPTSAPGAGSHPHSGAAPHSNSISQVSVEALGSWVSLGMGMLFLGAVILWSILSRRNLR